MTAGGVRLGHRFAHRNPGMCQQLLPTGEEKSWGLKGEAFTLPRTGVAKQEHPTWVLAQPGLF